MIRLQILQTNLQMKLQIKPAPISVNRPRLCGQEKKEPLEGNIEILGGEASLQGRLSSFELDALVVEKIDIAVNHLVGLTE